MLRSFLMILLATISLKLSAQVEIQEIDSLEKLLQENLNPDTHLDLHLQILDRQVSAGLITEEIFQARIDSFKSISTERQDLISLGKALSIETRALLQSGEREKAVALATTQEKKLREAFQIKDWIGPIEALLIYDEEQGDHQNIYNSIQLGLNTALVFKDTVAAAHYLTHFFQDRSWEMAPGNTDQMFNHLWDVLDYFDESKLSKQGYTELSYLSYVLAFMYNEWGDVNEAMHRMDEAEKASEAIRDTSEVVFLKGIRMLLIVYNQQYSRLDSLMPAFDACCNVNQLKPAHVLLPDISRGVYTYYRKQQPEAAVATLAQAYNQSLKESHFEAYRGVILVPLSSILLDLSQKDTLCFDRCQKDLLKMGFTNLSQLFDHAEQLLEESYLDASLLYINYLYPSRIRHASILGDTEMIIEYQAKLIELKRKAQSQDKMNLLSGLRARYKDKEMKRENELLKVQTKTIETRQRWGIAVTTLIIMIMIGMYNRFRFISKTRRKLETKNQQIEEEKKKAQASEQAKQQFLANMSHEIRTPMNAIRGMTQILLRRNPREEQLVYLNAVKESSELLLSIINDVLDLAKLEAGKIELESAPFPIEKVTNNVYQITQFKAADKGIGLEVKVDEAARINVLADQRSLQQIIINLIGNAIKFTEEGKVTLEIKSKGLDADGRHRLHMIISDTGIGIDKDYLPIIFQSFEQAYIETGRSYEGTGLGLSICKELVELQEGRIWVESEKGKGSQFQFEIPFTLIEGDEEIEKIGEDLSSPQLAEHLRGLRVLLVDDNPFNLLVASEELEDSIPDVVIVKAHNGQEAVDTISQENFDILLMDVQMPIMNGYDATRSVRSLPDEAKARTPIIAMTANVLKEELDRCFAAGMNAYVSKPFETEFLLRNIYEQVLQNGWKQGQ